MEVNIRTLFSLLSLVLLLLVLPGRVSAQGIKALTIERIDPEDSEVHVNPGEKVKFKVKAKSSSGVVYPIDRIEFSATGNPEVFGRERDKCVFFCGADNHSVQYRWGDVWSATVTATVYSKMDSVIPVSVTWAVNGTPPPPKITRIVPKSPQRVRARDPLTFEIEATSSDNIKSIKFSSFNPKTWFFSRPTRSHSKSYTWNTPGQRTVTATIETGAGGTAEFTWKVEVVPPNRPPIKKNREATIRLAPLEVGGLRRTLNMSDYFRDPDGDRLIYNTELGLELGKGVIRLDSWQEESDSKLVVVPKTVGVATFTVTASDGTYSVKQTFVVEVKAVEPPPTSFPDLVVELIIPSKTTLASGEKFRLDTIVRNQGDAPSQPTTLRFYRSADPDISPNDTQLHEQKVHRIKVGQQITPWKRFTAPDVPGDYYYGVCVDRSGDERAIDNNCSEAIKITVLQPTLPDLVVESISASKTTLTPGESFTLTATIRNIGTARSQFGVLRYYEQLGEADNRNIRRLFPDQTSDMSIQLEAPEAPGVYYYDACVSKVRDEVNKDNNCSTRIPITVRAFEAANHPPIASNTILDHTLTVGGSSVTVDVSGNFRDPDGDSLSYTVRSDNMGVARVGVSGSQVTLTPQGVGVDTVTVTASDGVLTAVQRFSVSVTAALGANRPPINVRRIPDQTLAANGAVARLDLSNYFSDPDGDTLKYIITSDNTNVAFLQVVGASVSILPLSIVGRANVRVTASDGNLTAIQDFTVRVQRTQPVNRPPAAIGTISPQTFTVNGAAWRVNVANYFNDTDGDSLTYTAWSDNTNVATVRRSGAEVTITPQGVGSTTIHVTASDGSLEATQSISVTVASAPPVEDPTSFDLAIQSVTPSKRTLSPGESFTLSVTIRNNGPGASGSVHLSYYHSSVQGRSPTDPPQLQGTQWLNGIASGDSITEVFRLNAPSTPKIYYYGAWLSAHTDDTNLFNDVATEVGVTVQQPQQVQNQAPIASGTIPAQPLTVGAAAGILLSGYFSDPDGDSLTYTARSDDTNVVTTQISGDALTITPLRAGSATITVTASDGSLTATHRFTVTVQSATFRVGNTVIVQNASSGGLNGLVVRSGAGTGFAHTISAFNGATGTITDGPRQNNGYTWWQVRWDRSNQVFCDVNPCVGWVFEFFQGTRVLGSPPDLIIESIRVSDDTLTPNESFKFYATVRNQGMGEASRTTLRYYRSSDATISTSDTEVDTDSVTSLDPNESDEEWDSLRAPDQAGVYYYGVCVDSVTDESTTTNNCSRGIRIRVEASSPDLVTESVRVSDATVEVGERFTLYATVRNQGNGDARRTTLRYYRSTDSSISDRDTEEDTDSVSSLDADETSDERATITAPNQSGTYYYGVCVDDVTDESNTNNNCSTGIRVTVANAIIIRPPPAGLAVGDSVVVQNASDGGLNGLVVRAGAGTGFTHIISAFNGATGTITDGPESANGYTWWKVRWDQSNQVFCDVNPCVGWVIEFFQGTRVLAEDGAAAPTLNVVIPTETILLSNYPNPFNPETWIPYQLSESADVSVSIYSVNGHLVRCLELGHQAAGVYRSRSRAAYWDGRNAFGERVASGLYFYTFTAGDFTATRKMLIRK